MSISDEKCFARHCNNLFLFVQIMGICYNWATIYDGILP
jgi:hypothetical protein